ncbi:sialic acid-binding Ig-like lectin 6 isoform X1 [Xiphophorus maculatus]|uniref:sialic acid-binding Ig-like lectin 6 isoform X1 n=1 Tax=Xiphophorus maculatus TaxID=8083 RepID=UPI000C6E7F36|nr:sialic acid-binding Ig-like lectin 6 isoform X1 [Xiphophorus maculatus]
MKSCKIQLTFKSIHCVKKGLPVCWSAASRMCFSLAIISSLLTFHFVSGAADDCESIKNPVLFITTPGNLEALSGSCLQVPCHFSAKERASFSGQNFGVWIKSDSRFKEFSTNVIFNSSGSIKTYPLEITGNLERQNCTTVFRSLTREHSDTYYFRIERTQFQATASCSGFRLTVRDSPWSPSINVPSDLKEHQSVTVTCSAFTPCPQSPPELTWNLQQDSLRQTEKNTEGIFTTKLQKNITLSDTHDGYNIRCSARYPVIGGIKTAETEVTLSVSYAPRNTSASISPSGLVSAGSRVELSCSSRAKPPPSFTWFRNSKHGATKVSVGPVYRLHMTNMTDLGSYYCEAENILGSQTSTPSHSKDHGTFWGAAAGGFIAIIAVICGAYILWRLKFKHSALRESQNSGFQEPTSTEENQDIHYGDIDFSAMRPSLKTARDETDLQNVMYSEVKVRRTGNRTESADGLYAQVKTKPVNPHFT